MAQFPRHIVQQRVNTGGVSSGMNAISISGPGRIQAPMLQPRRIQDVQYKAPVKLSPKPVVDAVQNFGNTLIDITMSIADKRARLFADEYHTTYRRHISNVLKNPEDGFLHTQELEATKQRSIIIKKINDAEQTAISSVPNHIKLYLGPLVREETSRALDTIANHVMAQEQKAVVSARTRRFNTITEIAYDNKRVWTPQQMEDFKNSEFEKINFPNQLARDEATDDFWNALILRTSQNIVIEDELSPEGTLFSRLQSLENLTKAAEPYVGIEQGYRNITVYERANSEVVSELKRRDAAEKAQLTLDNRAAINSIAAIHNAGGAYPERDISTLRSNGNIDDLDIKRFKSWWGSSKKEVMKDVTLYRKIYLAISNNVPRDEWEPELTNGYVTGAISDEWYKQLTEKENSMEDRNYKSFSDSMNDILEAWLITPTGFFGIPDEDENEMYAEAVYMADNILRDLKNKDNLNRSNFEEVKELMFTRFGIDRRIKAINVFSKTPSHIPSFVNTYEEALKVAEYYESQREEGKIDDVTFTMHTDRLEKITKLLDIKGKSGEVYKPRP